MFASSILRCRGIAVGGLLVAAFTTCVTNALAKEQTPANPFRSAQARDSNLSSATHSANPSESAKQTAASPHYEPATKLQTQVQPATSTPECQVTAIKNLSELSRKGAGKRAPLPDELQCLAPRSAPLVNEPKELQTPATVGKSIEVEGRKAPSLPTLTSQASQSSSCISRPSHSLAQKSAPLLPKLDSIVFVQSPANTTKPSNELPLVIAEDTYEIPTNCADQAVACDDNSCLAKAASVDCASLNYPSTGLPPILLAQAQDAFDFPDPSSMQQAETLGSTFDGVDSPTVRDKVDDSRTEKTIRDLSIDIRPRKPLVSKGAGSLVTEADLAGKSVDALDDSKNYTQSAGPASTIRTANYREFVWAAPNFYHNPLYFEQKNLERYGYHYGGVCMQSAISAAHFFATIPLLPYKMTVQGPHECDYTLGHYRPGNCAPNRLTCCEFDLNALAVEGAVATGCAFILY